MEDIVQGNSRSYSQFDFEGKGGFMKGTPTNTSVTLDRNAWKVSRLSTPYPITRHTWLGFNYTLKTEVDAHAICLDFDDVASDARKCIYLAGTRFDFNDTFAPESKFDLQRSKFGNLALGMEATQSSIGIHGVTEANKAVDGFIDPVLRNLVGIEKNSVAMTAEGENEWWRVKFDQVQSIQRIVIHIAKDFPLQNFCLKICEDSCALSLPIFQESFENNTEMIVDLQNLNVNGNIVHIERLNKGTLAIAEVLVFGPEANEDHAVEYKIPVGNMLMEGISFGFPIWDGVTERLDDLDGNNNMHIVTDAIVEFFSAPNEDITITSDIDISCTVTLKHIQDKILHTRLPPNCFLQKEIKISESAGNVKQWQVFGDKEPFTDERQIVYGRPLIKFVAMIQDSRDEEVLFGSSIFSEIELYEEAETSEETSMVRT